MIIAILIFVFILILLALNITIFLKSKDDTYKIYVKIGFITFLVPHQKIIYKIREKDVFEQRKDLLNIYKKRRTLVCSKNYS